MQIQIIILHIGEFNRVQANSKPCEPARMAVNKRCCSCALDVYWGKRRILKQVDDVGSSCEPSTTRVMQNGCRPCAPPSRAKPPAGTLRAPVAIIIIIIVVVHIHIITEDNDTLIYSPNCNNSCRSLCDISSTTCQNHCNSMLSSVYPTEVECLRQSSTFKFGYWSSK